MAFDLRLSRQLAKAGWKVKIRDRERLEEPHITIIKGTSCWRFGLRNKTFLDDGKWKDFPDELRSLIEKEENWQRLCGAWDEMYPSNPVKEEEDEDDGDDDEEV